MFLPARLVVARPEPAETRGNKLKSYEEVMQILEAFALTNSYRAAAELAGCSHHTVAHYVAMRDEGRLPEVGAQPERPKLIDPHLDKIEEWVERSGGKVRADVVFDKLEAVGYVGSDRTVRRAVAEVKKSYRVGRRRVYRPWITEPGMWAQWDLGPRPPNRWEGHISVRGVAGMVPATRRDPDVGPHAADGDQLS